MLVHLAVASQPSEPKVHSLMSSQVTPDPVYPELHPHVKLPGVFVHCALASQLCVVPHSSTGSLLQNM